MIVGISLAKPIERDRRRQGRARRGGLWMWRRRWWCSAHLAKVAVGDAVGAPPVRITARELIAAG
eukprot:1109394-Prymnesium_polylepis.2